MRRLFCTTGILFYLSSPPASFAAAAPPAFVFILVDDLGRPDLGCEGSRFYETPNIDRLAAQAMRFEYGYAACQVCSPSRAAIQSGKYPARLGITDYIGGRRLANQPDNWSRNTRLLPARYETHLSLQETTIAESLHSHGYRTFFAGKWHLGDTGFGPFENGYQINKGGHLAGTPPGGYFAPYRNLALTDGPPGEVLPIRLGRETAQFIKNHGDQPFFAMLSFYSVHAPIQCTRAKWSRYRAKAVAMNPAAPPNRFIIDRTKEVRQVQDHPVYAGMIEEMDTAVGMVLDAIDDSGIADRTIVIFTSDNGGVSSGDGFATSSLPFRGGKGRQWEGGIREPYYIRWPGVTSGTTTNVPATGMDFYPTILEIAGLPLLPEQHLDGVSLVPVLRGDTIPERPLFWHYPHYGNQGGEPSCIIRSGEWKLIHYFEDSRNELYRITRDVGEQHDLSAEQPDRVDALYAQLKAWQTEVGARFPTGNQNYDAQDHAQSMQQLREVGLAEREQQQADFLDANFVPAGGWWQNRER